MQERDAADPGERRQRDRQRRGPAALRRLLEQDLERGERGRHQEQRDEVEAARRARIARLARQQPGRDRDGDRARHDVDQEQPVPGIGIGDPAADDRPDGRRQHRQRAAKRGRDVLAVRGEQQEHRGEHRRDQHAAAETLQHPPGDQHAERPAGRAADRRRDEDRQRDDEQPAHAEHAGQQPGQRNGDDLGDQVRGLDPAHLVGADIERGADVGQRGRDHLDIEDRHEHAEAHGAEAEPDPDRNRLGAKLRAGVGTLALGRCSRSTRSRFGRRAISV